MGERRRRGRVGQIVRGNVDRLHGRDRAALGRGDALLQLAHFVGERRLIADGGGHAAEQGRDLAARLHKAENIVDEQQHVALLLVAEVFGHRKACERHAHTNAGRFVHLAEDERGLVDNAALVHLVPEVVALAAALAHAGEDRIAAVLDGDVVDEFLNEHRFTDARTAEQADLAAARIGLQKVDDLDAGLQDLNARALLVEGGGLSVDAAARLRAADRRAAVDGIAKDVEKPSERRLADGHAKAAAFARDGHAAAEALAAGEHDAAHRFGAQMLLHLHHKALAVQLDGQRLADARQLAVREAHVHHAARYLNDLTCAHAAPPSSCGSSCCARRRRPP